MDHILSLGAHPDVVDFKGRAAIMRAAELGNVECFERLALAGANMKIRDIQGKGSFVTCLSILIGIKSSLSLKMYLFK